MARAIVPHSLTASSTMLKRKLTRYGTGRSVPSTCGNATGTTLRPRHLEHMGEVMQGTRDLATTRCALSKVVKAARMPLIEGESY